MLNVENFSIIAFYGKIVKNTSLMNTRFYNEILPCTKSKIFMPNPNKKYPVPKKPKLPLPYTEKQFGPRKNRLDIQMLSKAIYDQVFKQAKGRYNVEVVEQCYKELLKHGMQSKESDFQKDVDYRIPPLKGDNIEDHFRIIGEEQAKPYQDLVLQLLERVPKPPTIWIKQAGWTRYKSGCEPQIVPYPLEEALVFDVEVCMAAGKSPTVATAVSSKAWYSWVSDTLIDKTSKPVTNSEYPITALIPIESNAGDNGLDLNDHQTKPKVIVGHNVSYDRARIKEQYWLRKTGTRFVDTMSLHICVGGLTSYQRAVLKSKKFTDEDDSWKNCSSLNSLADCYKLYCGKKIDKVTRDLFVEGTLPDINEQFQEVMTYCCKDVMATYDILKVLFPLFLERFPHPVTLAGMLELGTAYLPVNSNWPRYISEAEQAFEDLESESKILLARRADQACQMLHDDRYKEDLWMWDQDWTVKNIKLKMAPVRKSSMVEKKQIPDDDEADELEEKFRYLFSTKDSLPSVRPLLAGYPEWYRKLCTKPNSTPLWVPGPHLISTSMRITPKLLCLTWEGYPLHYLRDMGWGFLVPFSNEIDVQRNFPLKQLLEKCPLSTTKTGSGDLEAMQQGISVSVQQYLSKREYCARLSKINDKTKGAYRGSGIWCNTEVEDCCWFFKLPHKDGTSYNVGNPLAKDFLNKFSDNVLAGDTESAEHVLAIARNLSYWRNNRDRIMEQMVVWLDQIHLPDGLREKGLYGAIVPQVVVCGTLTRRAVEPTWMTASNAHPERIGSELRAMVQAPEGYRIVGADVDSQELWIASVLGDAHRARLHGATPLGWMTLSGSKSTGTDMHSVTAKAVGISRDHAKVINYARIYGAGQNFAERLLKQFNPTMSDVEARSKAQKMFALTKGRKSFHLKREYLADFADEPYSRWQAFEMAKLCGKTVDEMFHTSKWHGGTESAMFNRLEEIANSDQPRTPFLEGRLSRALEPPRPDDRHLPTRVNWVVQSGAADFLHLMLVCMRWMTGDKTRFCLSFHDEVRYLVEDRYRYPAALALHTTNLLTRAFCSHRLGLDDLPQSVAFFSSVEIDGVLRKEAGLDCVTPSNPHGLANGYGIGCGESLDIHEAVRMVCGRFTCWYKDFQVASNDKDANSGNVQSNKKKTRAT